MKTHLFKLAVLAATLLTLQAASPEEAYAQAYHTIRQADELLTQGSEKEALVKYFEAQSHLKALTVLHPGWQKKVVDFRLHYLDLRIQPLAAKFESKPEEAVAASAAPADAPPVAATAKASDLSGPISLLQKQVQALAEQNARLIERLRQLETQAKVEPAAKASEAAPAANPEVIPAAAPAFQTPAVSEGTPKVAKRSFWDRFKRKKTAKAPTEISVSTRSSRELKAEERRIKRAQARAQAKLNKFQKQQRRSAEARGGSRRLAGNTGAR